MKEGTGAQNWRFDATPVSLILHFHFSLSLPKAMAGTLGTRTLGWHKAWGSWQTNGPMSSSPHLEAPLPGSWGLAPPRKGVGDVTHLPVLGLAQKPLRARGPMTWPSVVGDQDAAHPGAHIPAPTLPSDSQLSTRLIITTIMTPIIINFTPLLIANM